MYSPEFLSSGNATNTCASIDCTPVLLQWDDDDGLHCYHLCFTPLRSGSTTPEHIYRSPVRRCESEPCLTSIGYEQHGTQLCFEDSRSGLRAFTVSRWHRSGYDIPWLCRMMSAKRIITFDYGKVEVLLVCHDIIAFIFWTRSIASRHFFLTPSSCRLAVFTAQLAATFHWAIWQLHVTVTLWFPWPPDIVFYLFTLHSISLHEQLAACNGTVIYDIGTGG